jgi:sulfopyruvate decarboxylase subunit beta
MQRIECLRAIYPRLHDCLVVTIMGAVASELHSLGHRPNFFYLQHAMGLASSMGLGLALSLPRQRVVVFDGDGSVLMNLGTFSTMARYRPPNLLHVIFDNESLLSVGGFPTATSTGADLEAVARGCGIAKSQTVRDIEAFRGAFEATIDGSELACVVAKVEAIGPKTYVNELAMIENHFEFRRYIKALQAKR